MAMVDLAHQSSDTGNPVSLADVAERQEISLSYLEQLFGKLRRNGLVKSVRGPGGGYLLSRDSSELRVSDIIMAVDEPLSATRCQHGSGRGCHNDKSRCITHDLWEELTNQIYVYLNSVSLADVCNRNIVKTTNPMMADDVADIIAAAQ